MSDHYDRYNGMDELLSTNLAEVGTDLIDRQAAIEAIHREADRLESGGAIPHSQGARGMAFVIGLLPSAEPQIIRCKECKHRGTRNCVASFWSMLFKSEVADDFYCGIAERVEVEHESN